MRRLRLIAISAVTVALFLVPTLVALADGIRGA